MHCRRPRDRDLVNSNNSASGVTRASDSPALLGSTSSSESSAAGRGLFRKPSVSVWRRLNRHDQCPIWLHHARRAQSCTASIGWAFGAGHSRSAPFRPMTTRSQDPARIGNDNRADTPGVDNDVMSDVSTPSAPGTSGRCLCRPLMTTPRSRPTPPRARAGTPSAMWSAFRARCRDCGSYSGEGLSADCLASDPHRVAR